MDKSDYIQMFIYGSIIVLGLAYYFVQSYFEMSAFNRFSNVQATYLDALFSNLRIVPR